LRSRVSASRTASAGELEVIRDAAKRLLQQHSDLADQVADALRKAKDEAPEEPGLFDRIGEMLGDLIDGIKELATDVWNFVKEHADVIAKIGEVLSKVGNVGILCFRRWRSFVDLPGGQGVAGSNPVVPTVARSPLTLDKHLGQRAFSCLACRSCAAVHIGLNQDRQGQVGEKWETIMNAINPSP
jgi:hypothetical protein